MAPRSLVAGILLLGCSRAAAQDVAVPCDICPDGGIVGGSLYSVEECQEEVEGFKQYEEGDLMCESFAKSYTIDCCPLPATNPCNICPDTEIKSGWCQEEVAYYVRYEEESNYCDTGKSLLASTCCPPPPTNPCNICPDGEVKGDWIYSKEECEEGVNEYKQEEEDDDMCEIGKILYASSCCPAPATNPCDICPDGIMENEGLGYFDLFGDIFGSDDGFTCEGMIEMAKNYEAGGEDCLSMESFKMICCPSPATDPCEVCPNGITATGDSLKESMGTTIDEVLDANDIDEPGDDFDALMDMFNAEDFTCEGVVEMAKMHEAGSEMCLESIEAYEYFCCPADSSGTIPTTVENGTNSSKPVSRPIAEDETTSTTPTVENEAPDQSAEDEVANAGHYQMKHLLASLAPLLMLAWALC